MPKESTDKTTSIQALKDAVAVFRDERGWSKHHTPKNLAMSIAIEAAELMELFQWEAYTARNQEKIAQELADILIYCFNFADTCDIDIAAAFTAKLDAAKVKYPLKIFKDGQNNADEYDRIKKAYRGE